MEKKLESFLKHILVTLDKLEAELKKTERDWIERKGIFQKEGYVYRENMNVFDNELKSIAKTKELINNIDLKQFNTVDDFKAKVISELEDLYDQSILMRSGISLIINLINRVDKTSLPDLKIE